MYFFLSSQFLFCKPKYFAFFWSSFKRFSEVSLYRHLQGDLATLVTCIPLVPSQQMPSLQFLTISYFAFLVFHSTKCSLPILFSSFPRLLFFYSIKYSISIFFSSLTWLHLRRECFKVRGGEQVCVHGQLLLTRHHLSSSSMNICIQVLPQCFQHQNLPLPITT